MRIKIPSPCKPDILIANQFAVIVLFALALLVVVTRMPQRNPLLARLARPKRYLLTAGVIKQKGTEGFGR
jgi:hypothetical protein